MPGKHAPAAAKSFYLSLARTGGVAVTVAALIAVVAVLAVRSGKHGTPQAGVTILPTESPTFFALPTVTPSAKASRSSNPSPSAKASPSRPAVTVAVLNGTSRGGLAKRTADRVTKAGYRVVRVGNTSKTDKSTILY